MKRRIILIVVVALVLLGIGAGIGLYVHRNRGFKLLARSELALRAQNYDRAADLARKYIEQRPDDWRGHFVLAEALHLQTRYEDQDGQPGARTVLKTAQGLAPNRPELWLLEARTWSDPATRSLVPQAARERKQTLDDARGLLEQANAVLTDFAERHEDAPVQVSEAIGLNQAQVADIWTWLERLHSREADTAEVARDSQRRDEARREADQARRQARLAYEQAINTLLDGVVRKEPARSAAVSRLIDICLGQRDAESLSFARAIIESMDEPPVLAYARLLDSEARGDRVGRAVDPLRIEKGLARLDELLADKPDEHEARVIRAGLALDRGDLETAEATCNQVLGAQPGLDAQTRARFVLARITLIRAEQAPDEQARRGLYADAEKELYDLKTRADLRSWPEIHLIYGVAAMKAGRKESAREAWRSLLRTYHPGYVDAARHMIESLLTEAPSTQPDGAPSPYASQAYADARTCYEAARSDPRAVELLIQTAIATDNTAAARKALDETATRFPDRLEMLDVVAGGYRGLLAWLDRQRQAETDPEKLAAIERAQASHRQGLLAIVRRIADAAPATSAERLIVARALLQLGRPTEAEKLLLDVVAEDPGQPDARFLLGRVFLVTRRPMQACDEFRQAVQIVPANLEYRQALASTLYNLGLLEDARGECRQVLDRSPNHADAALLMARIRTSLGESVGSEELLSQGESPRGLLLARTLLAQGRPEECIELCKAELAREPDNPNALVLLGGAYGAMGRRDDCVAQWAALLKLQPDVLANYQRLAVVFAAEGPAEHVGKSLSDLPGARPEMVDSALGMLHMRRRRFAESAEAFARVAARTDAPAELRQGARMDRARALAEGRQFEPALAELDKLAEDPAWSDRARLAKAGLLIATGRTAEAEPLLADIARQAGQAANVPVLTAAARLYAQAALTDKALEIAEQVSQLHPNEPGGYLLAGSILASARRVDDAISRYRQALQRQPGSLGIYTTIAGLHDASNRPADALAVLDELPSLGESGRVEALYQRGMLLSRWGLSRQAVAALTELEESGYGKDPRLQFFLGQAFARLGEADRARQVLAEVPRYADQYLQARQIMVALADSTDRKLALLDELERTHADRPGVLAQRMSVMIEAGRSAEAVKAFEEYRTGPGQSARVAPALAEQALRAMLRAEDLSAAEKLADELMGPAPGDVWRIRAMLLKAPARPADARALLPQPANADALSALLGVAISTGPDKTVWRARLGDLAARGRAEPAAALPAPLMLLTDLACGDLKAADDRLAAMDASNTPAVVRSAADALVAAVRTDPSAADDADVLIRATLAALTGLNTPARTWAMDLLKARPTCQWAADIVFRTESDPDARKKVLEILRPADCLIAQVFRAAVLESEDKYVEAADVYADASRMFGDDPALLLNQGAALEGAGRFEQALAVYRQAWTRSRNPLAANNAAYLVSQLAPQDAAQLAEVQTWLDAAEQAAQAAPGLRDALRDTRGWIQHLRGNTDLALADLRQAVKGLPESPEVHHHLAVVERSAGNLRFARWHAQAAVDIGQAYQTRGAAPKPAETRAIRAAAELLDALNAQGN